MSANYDNLMTLLVHIQHSFNVIGLTETRVRVDTDYVVNTGIPGDQFLSQLTLHKAGSGGFCIENDIVFHLRFVCNYK